MLFISVRTAETHRAHIMQKLALKSRAELVRYALAEGLLEGDDLADDQHVARRAATDVGAERRAARAVSSADHEQVHTKLPAPSRRARRRDPRPDRGSAPGCAAAASGRAPRAGAAPGRRRFRCGQRPPRPRPSSRTRRDPPQHRAPVDRRRSRRRQRECCLRALSSLQGACRRPPASSASGRRPLRRTTDLREPGAGSAVRAAARRRPARSTPRSR